MERRHTVFREVKTSRRSYFCGGNMIGNINETYQFFE